jgi:toxin ParE1/3/4
MIALRPRAERYRAAVEATFARIATHPLAGVRHHSEIHRLAGMRKAPVKGFESYLIFYVPRRDGADIIRLLHGSRDIAGVLRRDEAL